MFENNNISSVFKSLLSGNGQSVYFLGIGGIGMSAIARYFQSFGVKVSGYDKTKTILTTQLESEGIAIHYTDDISKADQSAAIIIYTPAIPSSHTELKYFQENKSILLKRSDVLSLITEDSFNICVAGTHGKTTTSAMIGHLLRHSGFGCNAFLGGISTNYDTNFWRSDNNVSVVEADEYDRSFLKLNPDIAVITSMDSDHLDIYGTAENMQDAFISFTRNIKPKGILICKSGLKRNEELEADNKISYSLRENASAAHAENIRVENGSYAFDVVIDQHKVSGLTLNMGGLHNIENMVASVAVAHSIGIEVRSIQEGVKTFKGVKRRFEFILRTDKHIVIDDYAHHPEELRALINGAKELFPDKPCAIIFQPHLFSRTKDHAEGFAEVLSLADDVTILPIYPAREEPIPGVTSDLILEKIAISKKRILSMDEIIAHTKKNTPALLIIAGAGDIDTIVQPIKNILNN